MFTAIKNWIETLSVRGDVGLAQAQMRTMRQIQTIIVNVEHAQTKLDAAYAAGERGEIVKEYVLFRKTYRLEINKLLHVFLLNTTLLNRHMDEFVVLIGDGLVHGRNDEHTIIVRNFKEMVSLMEQQTKQLIANITSFDNTTYSAQRLIDIASQAREAQYNFKKAVIDEKALKKVRQMLDKDARAGHISKTDEAATQQMLATLKDDLDAESKAIGIILIMLQEILDHLGKQEQRVQGYQMQERYPGVWAKSDLQLIQDLEKEIHVWIGQEIAKLRLFMSKSERLEV